MLHLLETLQWRFCRVPGIKMESEGPVSDYESSEFVFEAQFALTFVVGDQVTLTFDVRFHLIHTDFRRRESCRSGPRFALLVCCFVPPLFSRRGHVPREKQ